MQYVVTTDHLAPSERFEYWHDMLAQLISPMRMRPRRVDSFTGTLRGTDSTNFNLIFADNDIVDVARTPVLIRREDADVFYLLVNYWGVQQFVIGRDVVELGPSDMVLMHTATEFYSRSAPDQHRQRGATALVAADAVPGGERRLHQLIGRRLSGQDSLVSLVAQHLQLLGTGHFDPDDLEQLHTVGSSLISILLARALRAEHALPGQTRREALAAQVRSYITANLADPRLSADTIAAAHHISTRTLHRLMQDSDVPLTALIRQLRLERCRHELRDPAHAEVPIHLIAARWGFTEASHFARAYRAAYGHSPSEDRARR